MSYWEEKRQNMRHYDQQAKFYHTQYEKEQIAKLTKIKKKITFDPKELILDLGCGTGVLFQCITEKVGCIIGVDLSKKALQQAKRYTINDENTHLICADADNAPFPNYVFNKVFAITILQNMPDPTKTISEIKQIIKPEGQILVTGLKKAFTKESFVKLLENSGLKIEIIIANDQLKGHIAICNL